MQPRLPYHLKEMMTYPLDVNMTDGGVHPGVHIEEHNTGDQPRPAQLPDWYVYDIGGGLMSNTDDDTRLSRLSTADLRLPPPAVEERGRYGSPSEYSPGYYSPDYAVRARAAVPHAGRAAVANAADFGLREWDTVKMPDTGRHHVEPGSTEDTVSLGRHRGEGGGQHRVERVETRVIDRDKINRALAGRP